MMKTTLGHHRRGISLIEVLFAMGILSVGILAMAALLPLGVYEMGQADMLDQTSTLGRAAFRDLEIRGYLQPKMWVDTQVGMLVAPVLNPDPDPNCLTGPTPGSGAANPAPGQRLVAYQYLPENCLSLFGQTVPGQYQLVTAPPYTPSSTNTPQSIPFALPTTFNNYPANNHTQPIAWNPLTNTPLAPIITDIALRAAPVYTALYPTYGLALPLSVPPFTATESPLVILDPLMVGAMGLKYLSTQVPYSVPTGTATVPNLGSLSPNSNPWTNIQTFPYQQTYVPGAPIIPRLTLLESRLPPFSVPGAPPSAAPQPPIWPSTWTEGNWTTPRFMPFAAADRIFRSADDLAFNVLDPTDRTRDRPTRSMNYDSGVTQPLPQQVQYQGNYSWFVMIAPSQGESDTTAGDLGVDPILSPDTKALTASRQFTASVVVCQNRVLDVPPPPSIAADFRPSEWMVPANVYAGGLGGGDVTLYGVDGVRSAWLAGVRPGSWLMLSGITVSAEIRMDLNTGSQVYWPKFKPVADWYRIVAVDDGSGLTPTGGMLNVTLAGSDWPQPNFYPNPVNFGATPPIPGVQLVNLNPNSNPILSGTPIYTYATVVEGVVGVYQKTISFDGDSLFSSH